MLILYQCDKIMLQLGLYLIWTNNSCKCLEKLKSGFIYIFKLNVIGGQNSFIHWASICCFYHEANVALVTRDRQMERDFLLSNA